LKVTRSDRKVTPYGGVIPILKILRDHGIPDLINKVLGKRPPQAQYSYDEIIITMLMMIYCGCDRLSNITLLEEKLAGVLGFEIPSHDTIGRVLKSLATKNNISEHVTRGKITSKDERKRKGRKTYEIITVRETNENHKLNELLVRTLKSFKVLSADENTTVDIDATIIPTKAYQAKKTYKKMTGFFPMVSLIGDYPVYIGMRNGNVSPMAEIKKTVINTLEVVENYLQIPVNKVRMDGGGYNLQAFNYMEEKGIKFYVGGVLRPRVLEEIENHDLWQPINLETFDCFWNCKAASIPYKLVEGQNEYRLIVLRADTTSKSIPTNWIKDKTGNTAYRVIISNDWDMPMDELVSFYNQRGTSETKFAELKNDFGWKYPPFGDMNQNTVYLFVMALAKGLYHAVKKFIRSKGVKQVRLNSRIKEFRFTFICVSCEVLSDGNVEFFMTSIEFEKIFK